MGWLLIAIWGVATIAVYVGAFIAAYKFQFKTYRRVRRREPITILKPVKGITNHFTNNIYSFFDLDYIEGDQLVFCCADKDDFAAHVIQRLMKLYPKVPAYLLINPLSIGVNPKINNIFWGMKSSKNDLFLISDDNAIAPRDYLTKLESEFVGGILTAVILGTNTQSFAGVCESVIMSTFYSRGLLLANAVGHPCVMGKSMMFRKSQLGDEALVYAGQFLAEDYAMGKYARELGWPVNLLSIPVEQSIGAYSLKDYWSRHLRWGKIRKFQARWAFCLELFFFSFVVTGAVGAMGFWMLSPQVVVPFLCLHTLTWLVGDATLILALNQSLSLSTIFAWMVREITYVPLWVQILFGNTITWRGKKFRLQAGGKLEGGNETGNAAHATQSH
jgi:ceramide glucosyltransferase